MTQNLRELISDQLVTRLTSMTDPQPVLVTREPFAVLELAITQFPAVLITATQETRNTITMGQPGAGRRQGEIEFSISAYVRGTQLDRKRNDLIERIEEALEADRYLSLAASGVTDSQIVEITIEPRQPPLAEIQLRLQVKYNYLRATT